MPSTTKDIKVITFLSNYMMSVQFHGHMHCIKLRSEYDSHECIHIKNWLYNEALISHFMDLLPSLFVCGGVGDAGIGGVGGLQW